VVADACAGLLLPALTVALLAYAAQLVADVPLATCTLAAAPAARFPKLQVSVWLAIEHVPGPLYAGLMLQPIPVPVGNESLRVAAVAVPVPLLLTANVYPIDAPAATVTASAVFVRLSAGHCTVAVADACTEALFPALTVALFGYAAQLDAEVALLKCTVAVTPGPRPPKVQFSAEPPTEHVPGPL
jgi:hypothetical protein